MTTNYLMQCVLVGTRRDYFVGSNGDTDSLISVLEMARRFYHERENKQTQPNRAETKSL
jgi:hypothetical protein